MIPADIPTILDCKVGDVGSTAAAYARGIFEEWKFDSATVNPFLGEDSIAPFLSYPDRGVIVLCKTSNPGSGEWQDLVVGEPAGEALFVNLPIESTVGRTTTRPVSDWWSAPHIRSSCHTSAKDARSFRFFFQASGPRRVTWKHRWQKDLTPTATG